jgi:hypothetical protein
MLVSYKATSIISVQSENNIHISRSPEEDAISAQFRADFCSKQILREAAVKFTESPKLGLMYLQQLGAIDNPLTPASVAKFLRIAPGLPKEVTGAFLGELGKEDPSYEAQGVEFHKLVLYHYVNSFELENQGILNCIRIFLSAFRLPGEAQQIDRILVAFSEHCHESCTEGRSGLIENPEVAYLLSFAIIMLNTDRHNPNVRVDRKMTLEQFIKYNTNYGADVHQTRDLPRDFLESLYTSISECPLRTEKNDISGAFTDEVWMDLHLQTLLRPEEGLLITTCFAPETLKALSTCVLAVNDVDIDNKDCLDTKKGIGKSFDPIVTTYNILTLNTPFADPINVSSHISGMHWIVDGGIVESIWMYIMAAGIRPFLRPDLTESTVISQQLGQFEDNSYVYSSKENISYGKQLLYVLMHVATRHKIQNIVDAVISFLVDFAGMTNVSQLLACYSLCILNFLISGNFYKTNFGAFAAIRFIII